MKNKHTQLLIALVILCLLSIATLSAVAVVSSNENSNAFSAADASAETPALPNLTFAEQTEAGTELIGAETLSQIRASLAGQKPFLTREKAIQVAETVQNVYESGTTFILSGLDGSDFTETVTLQKPLDYEALADTAGIYITGSASAEEATLRMRQIGQINEMITYTLFALTPAEYTVPAAALMSEDERGMSNSQSYLHITYLVLAGDYDTPEEAAALLRAESDEIAYIKCFGNDAVYHCGETEVQLTLDPWESAEYLAYWEEFKSVGESE